MNEPVDKTRALALLPKGSAMQVSEGPTSAWRRYVAPIAIVAAAVVVSRYATITASLVRARRRRARAPWVGAGIGLAALAVARWQLQRLVTPGPDFEAEGMRGDLELRRYPATAIARTTAEGDWDHALDNRFRRLADFIFGKNSANKRIEMRTPVLGFRDGDGYTIQFFMPSIDPAPSPRDARVCLDTLPGRRVAVLRWAGRYDGETVDAKKRDLLEALRGLETFGEPHLRRLRPAEHAAHPSSERSLDRDRMIFYAPVQRRLGGRGFVM